MEKERNTSIAKVKNVLKTILHMYIYVNNVLLNILSFPTVPKSPVRKKHKLTFIVYCCMLVAMNTEQTMTKSLTDKKKCNKMNKIHLLKTKACIVEALKLHSNTQSQWSSGSIVCSRLGGQVCIPGMHPHLQWNWDLLLVMSRYIGDPDVIPDHRLQ